MASSKFDEINYFQTKTEKIAYRYILSNPNYRTLLFIHGNMTSSYIWVSLIDPLQNKFNILCPDLSGFGKSSYNEKIKGLEDYSQEIYELLAYLQIKKVVLIGLSLGGTVSLKFCAKYKEIVSAAVLIGSVGIKGYYFTRKDYKKTVVEEKSPDIEVLEKDPAVATYSMCLQTKNQEFMQILLEKILFNVGRVISNAVLKNIIDEAFLQKNYLDSLWALNIYNISDSFNGIVKGTNEIEKIECPVLLIHGTKDKVIPLKESVQTFHALKSKKKVIEILENYGHLPHMDNAENVSKIIINFLEEIE